MHAQRPGIEQRTAAAQDVRLMLLGVEQAIHHRAQQQLEAHPQVTPPRLLPVHVRSRLEQGDEIAAITHRVRRAYESTAADRVERYGGAAAAGPLLDRIVEFGLAIIDVKLGAV